MKRAGQRRVVLCAAGIVLSAGLTGPAPIGTDASLIATPPPASPDLGTFEIGPQSTTAPDLLPPDRNRSEWEVTVSGGQWSLRSDASHDLVVADRFGNDVAVHHLPDGEDEWRVQSVFIDEGWMVLSEHADFHGDYQVWVYELDTGARRMLSPWDGSTPVQRSPRLALTGSWLAWEVTQDDGGVCLMVENLASRERYEPVCVASSTAMLTSPPAGSE